MTNPHPHDECPPECAEGRTERRKQPAWRHHHPKGGAYVDYRTPEAADDAAKEFGGTVEPINQDPSSGQGGR